jgi:hypothetical protein
MYFILYQELFWKQEFIYIRKKKLNRTPFINIKDRKLTPKICLLFFFFLPQTYLSSVEAKLNFSFIRFKWQAVSECETMVYTLI